MTDTEADHNIILMRKSSTGWERATLSGGNAVQDQVAVRVFSAMFVSQYATAHRSLSRGEALTNTFLCWARVREHWDTWGACRLG